MIVKRCVLCRKWFFSKNVIYVHMHGDDLSGNYCLGCLKGYLRSSIMSIREYVNSERFKSDPQFMQKLERIKNILVDK